MHLRLLATCVVAILATIVRAQTTTLTFSDDFSAGQLDRTKWTYGGGPIINNESQAYVHDAFSFSSAGLTIRTDRRSLTGGTITQNYTSGSITTRGRFMQTYGYFEACMKLPKGRGLWPAFWLLPANNSWPPEIDVMENLGHDPFTAHTTLHYNAPAKTSQGQGNVTGDDFSAGFHVYAISWRPQSLTFYIDGVQVYQITGTAVPATPMYMIVNTAVGSASNWPGPVDAFTIFPNTTVVRYVRAYQYSDVPVVPIDKAMFGAATLVNTTTGQTIDAAHPLISASPGDALTLTTSFVTAPSKALPAETIHVLVLDAFSSAVIADNKILTTAALPAGTTTPLTLNFTVPPGLAAGIYNLKLTANAYESATSAGYPQASFDPAAQFVVGSPLPPPPPPPVPPSPSAAGMNLEQLVFTTLPGRDSPPGTLAIGDNGQSASLTGNVWKSAPLPAPYTVTANTVLEFEFSTEPVPSSIIGNLYCIGFFPAGTTYSATDLNNYALTLAGNQGGVGISAFNNAARGLYSLQLGGTFRYIVPLGQYPSARGVMSNLLLVLKESTALGNIARFSRVRLYEGNGSVQLSVGWSAYPDSSILLDAMVVSPETVTLANGATQQFTALGMDGNGSPVTPAPSWSVTSGPGTIDANTGLYTAPASGGGDFTVTATYAGVSATATGNIPVTGMVLFDDAPRSGGTLIGGAALADSPVRSGAKSYGATASGYTQVGLSFGNTLTAPADSSALELYVYMPGPVSQVSNFIVQLGAPTYQTKTFSAANNPSCLSVDDGPATTTLATGVWHKVNINLAQAFGANWVPGSTKISNITTQVGYAATSVYMDDVVLK